MGSMSTPNGFVELRRLVRNVPNPDYDRRFGATGFTNVKQWEHGTVLVVFHTPELSHDRRAIGAPGSRSIMDSISTEDPRYALLVAASEPVELNTFDAVHWAYFDRREPEPYRAVLKYLVQVGTVKLDTVARLLVDLDRVHEALAED